VAHRGASTVVGEVYPSDWAPLIDAARVLTGIERPTQAASAGAGETPGLQEIKAVFPSGPPGQSAANNYELLRRRAYEYNLMWSFATSERDFEQLLAAHAAIAPDDADGEAEILAEIGLNMSSARRFDEAAEVLGRALALARSANDGLLATKIGNYQAVDQLNQRRYAAALRLALAANQARVDLFRASQAGGAQINASDVRHSENTASSFSQRSLIVPLTDATPADKSTILTAQGDYIAGVAARGLGHADAEAYLGAAEALLGQVGTPPAWLIADISNERADVRSAAGDFTGAANAAASGLAMIRTVAPGTRSEAHLLLTQEAALAGAGRTEEALASGRQALAIVSKQSESPGVPPDVAAGHLSLLEQEWRRTGDARLANEYFQTLALVWDGAAARSTAQLAARLVLRQAGDQARAYQDAERGYRAAYARRQALAADPGSPAEMLAQADAAAKTAATALADAEAALRERAPAYLELLSPEVTADDLRGVLGDHEAYLRVAMASNGGFGALVDKAGVHPFRIALTGAQVDALADRLRRTTRLHGRRLDDYDLGAAGALYAAIVAPVRERLADTQDLDVDVSGSLASVPFAALVATAPTPAQAEQIKTDQDYSGVDWLGRSLTVTNTLGPAAFVRLRKEPPTASATLHAAVYGDYQPNPAEAAERIAKEESLSGLPQAGGAGADGDGRAARDGGRGAQRRRRFQLVAAGPRRRVHRRRFHAQHRHRQRRRHRAGHPRGPGAVVVLRRAGAAHLGRRHRRRTAEGVRAARPAAEGAAGGAVGLRHGRRRQARRGAHRPGRRRRCAERPGARVHLRRRAQRAGDRVEGGRRRLGHRDGGPARQRQPARRAAGQGALRGRAEALLAGRDGAPVLLGRLHPGRRRRRPAESRRHPDGQRPLGTAR